MRALGLGLCGVLAGCAQLEEEAHMKAARATAVDLCYMAVAGTIYTRPAATAELQRRGSNCHDEMPLVRARLQAAAIASQAEANRTRAQREAQERNTRVMLEATTPPPPQPAPKTTHCETRTVFGALQTICQ